MGELSAVTEIYFDHDAALLPRGRAGLVPVLMYGHRPPNEDSASIAGPVRRAVRRLGVRVPTRAHDLLTIAMAVTAADTFVDKAGSDDGWTRTLHLRIPLFDPAPWGAVIPVLEGALNFLSGDLWSLDLVAGGCPPPDPQRRGYLTGLAGHDCVSLFSGGLDSAIGTLDLIRAGRRPLLVSHAYRGDAHRQHTTRARLPVRVSTFSAIANPVSKLGVLNDVQMRTRSFNFIVCAAVVAATMVARAISRGPLDLLVPENGLIALNPPLTKRRIGALSTRTTHPHFLASVQHIFDVLGIPAKVQNPYELMTKGEMLTGCRDQASLGTIASTTVSCGKWKRTGMQCGRCVPCIIRRASFHAAGQADQTPYDPAAQNLASVLNNEDARDDLLAMILAARRLPNADVGRWVRQAGPLPLDAVRRDSLIDVARRGLEEMRGYLVHLNLI